MSYLQKTHYLALGMVVIMMIMLGCRGQEEFTPSTGTTASAVLATPSLILSTTFNRAAAPPADGMWCSQSSQYVHLGWSQVSFATNYVIFRFAPGAPWDSVIWVVDTSACWGGTCTYDDYTVPCPMNDGDQFSYVIQAINFSDSSLVSDVRTASGLTPPTGFSFGVCFNPPFFFNCCFTWNSVSALADLVQVERWTGASWQYIGGVNPQLYNSVSISCFDSRLNGQFRLSPVRLSDVDANYHSYGIPSGLVTIN